MKILPFVEWPLRAELKKRLAEQGLIVPTEVQQLCWRDILAGRDLLVQSCTGTGKTLAFVLPLLNELHRFRKASILVILPTRELAMQVSRVINSLGGETALLYGGGNYRDQFKSLQSEAAFIVGTPGRLLEHLDRGTLDLSRCQTLILDEADEILDMGFEEEIDKILSVLPVDRQSLLFSATIPDSMEELASKTLRDPKRISVSIGLKVANEIRHEAYEVKRCYRAEALSNVLYVEDPHSAIIFCHTKAETEELASKLLTLGLEVLSLHGDMAQNERTRTLNAFRQGHYKYLVATDVAARGLDIPRVTHVINMAIPRDTETYIHRVGRTGRAGQMGKAITFFYGRESERLKEIFNKAKINWRFPSLPQAEDVRRCLHGLFHKKLSQSIAKGIDDNFKILAVECLGYLSAEDSLAGLLSMSNEASSLFKAGCDIPVPGAKLEPENKLREKFAKKALLASRSGFSIIQLNVGKDDSLSSSNLLKLISEITGLDRKKIGNIEVRTHTSFVEISAKEANQVVDLLSRYVFGKDKLKVRLVIKKKL